MSDTDPGYNFQEFPFLYWVIGKSYSITGENNVNGRLITLILCLFLIVGLYRLALVLGYSERFAVLFAYCGSFTPMFYYYAFNPLPNLVSLMLFIFAIVLMRPGQDMGERKGAIFLATVLLTVAVMQKISYLLYGLPLIWLFWKAYQESSRSKKVFGYAVCIALPVLAAAYWTYGIHAKHVLAMSSGEVAGKLTLHTHGIPPLHELARALNKGILVWFAEITVGHAFLPLFLGGIFVGFRQKFWKKPTFAFWAAWSASFVIFALMFIPLFVDHAYYQTAIIPVAALITAFGAYHGLQSKRWRPFVITLLAIAPAVMINRVYNRFNTDRQIPDELYFKSHEIVSVIPENERVAVLGESTPNVYLYYLRRKGLVVDDLDPENMAKLQKHGFQWLITRRETHLTDPVKTVGEFKVYRLTTN